MSKEIEVGDLVKIRRHGNLPFRVLAIEKGMVDVGDWSVPIGDVTNDERKFWIGDRIAFGGKTGALVWIVDADEGQKDALCRFYENAENSLEYNTANLEDKRGLFAPRGHESYFVAVEQGGKRRPKLYHPRVSSLELVD